MMKGKSYSRFLSYSLVIIILSALMVFPSNAYGRNNTKDMIAIKTSQGLYLAAENGGGSTLVGDREKVAQWETFEILDLGKGYIALKSYSGRYVGASDDGEKIDVNNKTIGKKQMFQLIKLDSNKVAFKTYDKTYLSIEKNGGKARGVKGKIGELETFELVKILDANIDNYNLAVTANETTAILTWNTPTTTKDIVGYNLYKGTSQGKYSNIPVTDFPIEGNSYRDTKLNNGITYYYILKAVYKDKTLGPASNEVVVSLKPQITLVAKSDETGITLYWSKTIDDSNLVGYNLYRGTKSGKQSEVPVTDFPIENVYYTDINIEDNIIYYYIVKPVYKDKSIGEASNEISIKSEINSKRIIIQIGSKYMYVNGVRKEIDPGKETKAILQNGRTFLPVRAVIEAMGGEIKWNDYDRRVSISLKNKTINLWIGNKKIQVNGLYMDMDVEPFISKEGRTMLPLRFITENLDYKVDWDGPTKTVTIMTGK